MVKTSTRRSFHAWRIGAMCACGLASTGLADTTSAPVIVRGSERILWEQPGASGTLGFRIYVDGVLAGGAEATCTGDDTELACSSPLPFLLEGLHVIAITAVSHASGLESAPSDPIRVMKVEGEPPSESHSAARGKRRATSAPDGAAQQRDTLSPIGAIDVLARGIKAPASLAMLDEDRLLVAEADGTVRVVRTTGEAADTVAVDTHALLSEAPLGALGIAVHPDVARTRFVYVAFLAGGDREDDVLRIVRFREVADTLGEPATIFESPLVTRAPGAALPRGNGPRLAFGPDGLLYVALPDDAAFYPRPGTSEPVAAMIRIRDDGAAADAPAMADVNGHVLGFDWDPRTAELWTLVREAGSTVLDRLASRATPDAPAPVGAMRMVLPGEPGTADPGALVLQSSGDHTRAFALVPGRTGLNVIGLAGALAPEATLEQTLEAGIGRIGDVVAGADGTFYIVTRTRDWVEGAESNEILVRVSIPRRER